jgi:hypothetical protein
MKLHGANLHIEKDTYSSQIALLIKGKVLPYWFLSEKLTPVCNQVEKIDPIALPKPFNVKYLCR